MASAFASGFKMGGDMFDSAERNRLAREQLDMAKAADARAAEAHGLQMKSARRIEDATQAVTDATSLGISVPGAQAGNEAAQRESFRRFEIADQNSGDGSERPQYVAPTGIQPTYRPASTLELNGLQSSLAAARGDVQGMETLRLARKGIEYDDGYKKHIADWKAMPDEERSKLIGKLSYDTGVKGFGTWTPGQGKQAGYMTYLPPTGDAVKLSDKEAGEVYALSNLMSIDPTRARGELDKVSDKVRAVAAQVFSSEYQGVTANNQATHNAAADRAAATTAGAAALNAQTNSRLAGAHIGVYEQQSGTMRDAREGRVEAAKIAAEFDGLTDAEKNGPRGRGLMVRFNMANAKAGGQLSIGGGKGVTGGKFTEPTAEGTLLVNHETGERGLADGLGNIIPTGMNGKPTGIMPRDRQSYLLKLGVPENMLGEMVWNKGGDKFAIGNTVYSAVDKNDVKLAVKDWTTANAEAIARAEQARAAANPAPRGLGPRVTFGPAPGAPSIYASPEEWQGYRRSQQQ